MKRKDKNEIPHLLWVILIVSVCLNSFTITRDNIHDGEMMRL